MARYFGTDGVRGVANLELTPELAYKLGRAGAFVLTQGSTSVRAQIAVGKDTRISGDMLEASLVAGILSVGVDVLRLGVIPTPGVSYLTRKLGCDAGVMISASHNPVPDNGIKFFGGDGFKLTDEQEAEFERLLDAAVDELPRPTGEQVGRIVEQANAGELFTEFQKSTISHRFDGIKVVLDCGNGAASYVAGDVFRSLGADVIVINAEPTGTNINVGCGSTHPEKVQEAVLAHGAAIGLSFDGDADRLIAVDDQGQIVDGDYIMGILGVAMKKRGALPNNTVVSTVMSNIGFHKAMREQGIDVKVTAVGDRYVMEEMRAGGYGLGGEQSGHIILLQHNTTGDGLLTALHLTDIMVESQQSLSSLRSIMRSFPQILVNVRVVTKDGWKDNAEILAAIQRAEEALGADGRVLVRPSGTEPLIRVMAEGPEEEALQGYVNDIANVVRREQGER
ncbi:phosphoglucosamine mutase [Tumebacillus permanentifrigoris]|uniref:Phosphoglucosamine mutase n=1 Tax=Tumebacillus permanentifrigoris TaxID=378543 RepID=A0A316DHR5_9BACL|nr:phosphoglucosamine mutase [Tumebacillus permanentifrigoris]PWK16153.1 phosphoglucosamine mutase [Tumebacillus permanentifrigoris]